MTHRPRYKRSPRLAYVRERDLGKLLALWPGELDADTPETRDMVIGRLRRALREERARGLGGHWAYDLARHAALLAAYRAEVALASPARGQSRCQEMSADQGKATSA